MASELFFGFGSPVRLRGASSTLDVVSSPEGPVRNISEIPRLAHVHQVTQQASSARRSCSGVGGRDYPVDSSTVAGLLDSSVSCYNSSSGLYMSVPPSKC